MEKDIQIINDAVKSFKETRDEKSFEIIYKSFYNTIYFTCFSYVKNEDEAMDLVQSVFLTVVDVVFVVSTITFSVLTEGITVVLSTVSAVLTLLQATIQTAIIATKITIYFLIFTPHKS